LSGCSNIEIFN
ncbi:hypothetical protein F2X78_04960, partial [Staphylococcus aureus]